MAMLEDDLNIMRACTVWARHYHYADGCITGTMNVLINLQKHAAKGHSCSGVIMFVLDTDYVHCAVLFYCKCIVISG